MNSNDSFKQTEQHFEDFIMATTNIRQQIASIKFTEFSLRSNVLMKPITNIYTIYIVHMLHTHHSKSSASNYI